MSIGQGQWVIFTGRPPTFTKVCENSNVPSRVTVEPPMGLITLDQGCQASSKGRILPTEGTLKSTIALNRINFSVPTLMKIWQPADQLMKEYLIKIHKKLKRLASIQPPMENLMYQLQQELPLMDAESVSCWIYILVGSSVCVRIILLGIGVCCWFVCRYSQRGKPKISKAFNTRVRFYGDMGRSNHSSNARVLGYGGNQTSTSDGIQDEND